MRLLFWRKKGAATPGRLDSNQAPRAAGPFGCSHCHGDVRRETLLTIRHTEGFYALFPDVDGKPRTAILDDDNDSRTAEGRFVCTACALGRQIPGLDREKLKKLIEGLKTETHLRAVLQQFDNPRDAN